MTIASMIRWFRESGIEEVHLVGGKNASLSEMYRELVPKGIRIPNGFAVTAEAYRVFLRQTGLTEIVTAQLTGLDSHHLADLAKRGASIREAILSTPLPAEIEQQLTQAYQELEQEYGADCAVAVRSSATAEDLPEASFAGQQESYLNVRGIRRVLTAYHHCLASLFTDRAISYRIDKGFDHFAVALSVGVQVMVRADVGTSGVMFTLDTESGFSDVIMINAALGLGEMIVKGRINPDEFLVHKPTLRAGKRPILKRALGAKQEKMIYADRGGQSTRIVPVAPEDRNRLCISDEDVLQLAHWGLMIEEHYTNKKGSACPQDIEWAKDGITGELYILQARPETVHSLARSADNFEVYRLKGTGTVLLQGKAVGEKIGAGPARVIRDPEDLASFQPGEVLIADMTDPDWEPTMKMAGAIVTNRGGRTCHAAIVSRELGVPCLVGTGHGTELIRTGQQVTVTCADGETGRVLEGAIPFEKTKIDLSKLRRPQTKIMMNLGNPSQAFSLAGIPNDGVGLARMEFIISSLIQVHPMALLQPEKVLPEDVEKIARLTVGYTHQPDYFVDRLAEGVGQIAAAYYPKDVIVRLSDFKTNEYAGLIGGKPFEPVEENPMIGFRGASRYYDDRYRDGFLLECAAMKRVREEMGLTNLKLMIPFCRTVEEGKRVLKIMADAGLLQGENGLELYVMCEIPSNVVLAEEFAEIFDGFSIGSNDLTQLTLGLDRDSEIVAHLFDERNAAVKKLVADVIRRVKACGRKVGICGQAPSDYPDFAEFLVECGIDSISLTPDTILKTTQIILDKEQSINSK
ncbi:MAG: phosphoenolpyruvate synthase [Zavarzinella sp.]